MTQSNLRPCSLHCTADNLNYCSVPLTGQDAFLFMGLALLIASVCMGKLSAIWMLVAGTCVGGVLSRPGVVLGTALLLA